ncbi:hypothetical protein BDR03DRAFT_126499 [Suillus americanus]|nr:hypothetical protein BDR03DRAFT_126499 [Suillus americanus]
MEWGVTRRCLTLHSHDEFQGRSTKLYYSRCTVFYLEHHAKERCNPRQPNKIRVHKCPYNGEPHYTLASHELLDFILSRRVDRHKTVEIMEDEIEDKGKRDMISKAVFILQITWFLTQYITRYVEHLAITQREVGTLELAVLTLINYCF